MKWGSGLMAAGSLLLAVSACGDDGGSGAALPATARSLSASLEWFPGELAGASGMVTFADLDGLRNGTKASSLEDDVRLLDERSDHGAVMPSALSSSILDPDFAAFAGFDTRNIGAWAEMGQLPDMVTVLVGRFDAGTIEKALRSSPGGDELAVQRDGDVVTFSLGAPGSNDYSAVSPIRRIGGPLVIALVGDVLVWGSESATVAACVAAHGGPSSAARLPVVADVAAALDVVAPASGGITAPLADESWLLAGFGESRVNGVSTITIALRYAKPEEAQAAVGAFRDHIANDSSAADGSPWAGTVTVVDVRADGSTMIATVTTERSLLVQRNLQQADNLLTF